MRIFIFLLLVSLGAGAHANGAQGTGYIENSHDAPAAFELQDVQGQLHRLSDYQGKWVIVNFWATWCSPCIKEIPELMRFHQQYRDQDIVVIGINFEELTVEQLQQAIDEFNIDYPVLRIGSVPLVPFEPLKGLPSTFAVSPQGRLVKSWIGPVDGEVLQSFIASQLERKTS
jgi:thiol-disulfide isomerase/thioredoxin